jgi:predicted O-methyltransferase YrrM
MAVALSLSLQAFAALQDHQAPPYVGTPMLVVERMLALAKVGAADTVVDLGSGDGRIVIHAAKHMRARGIGVEMMPSLVEESRRNAERAGVEDRVRFIAQDARAADLREATVLTLYLGPDLNFELMPRILATMRPGARVVSHDFGMRGWTPDAAERFEVPDKNYGRGGESAIYLWIVPANVIGRWQATLGEGAQKSSFEFSIGQQFQFIEGAVHGSGKDRPLRAATLSGDRIAFELPEGIGPGRASTVSARADGDRMGGVVRTGATDPAPVAFTARRIGSRPDLYQ